MNYFQLFDIPISFNPDKNKLQQQFYMLSKKYHPDFYSLHSDEEKAIALEQSSHINIAYKTLVDNDAVLKYILQLKDLIKDDEKYILSPDFLMEMMELNEQLTELDREQISNFEFRISKLQKDIYEPIKQIVENYKEGVTTEKELLQVKDYYYKKKYLDRILEGMER